MLHRFILVVFLLVGLSPFPSLIAYGGSEIPGRVVTGPIAITGGTVHTVTSGTMRNGTVVFTNGSITAVGELVDVPEGATVIDARGKHVYPGFIGAQTTLGLNEIGAVRATRDAAEVGRFNPNVRAETAYDPDSDIIPTVRSNGILIANVSPEGGLISGLCSVMRLDGWTREDIAIEPRCALVVNWPSMSVSTSWWEKRSPEEQRKDQQKQLDEIRRIFEGARAYAVMDDAGLDTAKRNLRLEAMRSVFDGSLPVIFGAQSRQQILAVLDFIKEFGINGIVAGGAEAGTVAELLKQQNVPVILDRVHRLPGRAEDGYDDPYTLPARLQAAGIRFCINEPGYWSVRSLPFEAGTAIAYGLQPEAALAAITIAPAHILGIADRYGSIDVGKSATLFISDGDALDVRSNKVTHAWIDGRPVDLDNRHKRLSKKYRSRYQH